MKRRRLLLAAALPALLLLPLFLPAAEVPPEPSFEGRLHLTDATAGGDVAVRQLAFDFARQHPKLEVTIERQTPAAAQQARRAGETDLILIDEETLGDEADRKKARRYGAAVALVIVNSGNSKRDFSAGELRKIYAGEYADWTSLNGSAFLLHRLLLQADKPAEQLFRARIMKETPCTEAIYRKPDSQQLLLVAAFNPNTVAVVAYPNRELDDAVLAAAVDGIPPSLENLKNGKYPLCRFRAVLPAADVAPAAAQAFLAAMQGADFRTLLRENELFAL